MGQPVNDVMMAHEDDQDITAEWQEQRLEVKQNGTYELTSG